MSALYSLTLHLFTITVKFCIKIKKIKKTSELKSMFISLTDNPFNSGQQQTGRKPYHRCKLKTLHLLLLIQWENHKLKLISYILIY